MCVKTGENNIHLQLFWLAWTSKLFHGDLAPKDIFRGQPVERNGVVLQFELTEHAQWRPFWGGGEPTEGANRSHDQRGECTCGERKKIGSSLFSRFSRSLSLCPPHHSSSSLTPRTPPPPPPPLHFWRLLLLSGGHEKKAGMMLPWDRRGETCCALSRLALGALRTCSLGSLFLK